MECAVENFTHVQCTSCDYSHIDPVKQVGVVDTCGGVSYDASKTWASSPHGRHALPELNISLTDKFIFLVTSGKIQLSDKLI